MQDRWYQSEAVQSVFDYYESGETGNPVIALPTGTGKSVVIARLCKRILESGARRIIKLTHRHELISQNFEKLLAVWSLAPAGIYSAGIGRREAYNRITFAGIGSVCRRAALFAGVDVVIIDECHTVSPKVSTTYQKFIAELKAANPALVVIGLTATPYRLGQGMITNDGLFTDICYDLTDYDSFNRLISEGWLAPLVSKKPGSELDYSGVQIRNGDFAEDQLQIAVDKPEVTRRAINEMLAGAADRKSWLIFASGVKHADHIAEELCKVGIPCRPIHSKIPKDERKQWIQDFKTGRLRAISNNDVLTTGFDHPGIDFIGHLRPTCSTVVWVQTLGRGTRPAPGKHDCLVYDFAGNTRRLGPINDPVIPRPRQKQKGDAPVKLCPHCDTYNHTRAVVCVSCGKPFEEKVRFHDTADTAEVLKTDKLVVEEYDVDHIEYACYEPKDGRATSLKVTYVCGPWRFNEWASFESESGLAKHKARNWWRVRSLLPPPDTTGEAYERRGELEEPHRLRVWVNKRPYPEILEHLFPPRT